MNKTCYYPVYPSGITGYEVWLCKDNTDYANVLYVGTQREQIAHRHKIQRTPSGRPFIRTSAAGYRRRIYVDELFV